MNKFTRNCARMLQLPLLHPNVLVLPFGRVHLFQASRPHSSWPSTLLWQHFLLLEGFENRFPRIILLFESVFHENVQHLSELLRILNGRTPSQTCVK